MAATQQKFSGISELYNYNNDRDYTIESIRNSFWGNSFDIEKLYRIKGYDTAKISNQVVSLHKKYLSDQEQEYVRRYLVNLFLCPDSTTEEELEAVYREVFTDKISTKEDVIYYLKLENKGLRYIIGFGFSIMLIIICLLLWWRW